MKLKGLNKRAYSILFHTHTVSGIVISFALFIIFYAGAFSLFRHEMYKWGNPEARFEVKTNDINFEQAIVSIKKAYPNFAEQEQFTIRTPNENMPYLVFFGAEQEIGEDHTHRFSAHIDPRDYSVTSTKKPKTTLSETLYRLHFFSQIPAGLYISGFVALFFLFATITGLLIHWRNLITKFYGFVTKGKWKQVWTSAHTVLGVIGLPFQVIYAVTGAFFGLLTLLLIPSALILFGGDTDAILTAVRPESGIKVDKEAAIADNLPVNDLYEIAAERFKDYKVEVLSFRNYGRIDAIANFIVNDHQSLLGDGTTTLKMQTGEVLMEVIPNQKTYTESVLNLITKLHFGSFGGIVLKIVYFIMALLTCFMLISGVLIWQAARDNKKYTAKQRLFQHRVTKTYLAICLSMFPAVALIFLANKLVPLAMDGRAFYVNAIFFIGWLGLTVLGIFWDNYARINRNYLLLGGVLSLFVPLLNGWITGDWFWKTLTSSAWQVASVDIFWGFTGIISLVVGYNLPTILPKKAIVSKRNKQVPVSETAVLEPVPALLSNKRS